MNYEEPNDEVQPEVDEPQKIQPILSPLNAGPKANIDAINKPKKVLENFKVVNSAGVKAMQNLGGGKAADFPTITTPKIKPISVPKNVVLNRSPSTIEQKLDRIIDLLEKRL